MPLVTPVYELAPATSMQDRCSITESTCKVAEKEAEPGTAAALTLAERGSQSESWVGGQSLGRRRGTWERSWSLQPLGEAGLVLVLSLKCSCTVSSQESGPLLVFM